MIARCHQIRRDQTRLVATPSDRMAANRVLGIVRPVASCGARFCPEQARIERDDGDGHPLRARGSRGVRPIRPRDLPYAGLRSEARR